MNRMIRPLSMMMLLVSSAAFSAGPDTAQLAVWANEAIVATYTYDFKNYLQQQKTIAKYFTSQGWITYSKALNDSKLPEAVQKNSYFVSAVATQPPKMVTLDPTHWQAVMPILVVYKNPQYQQQQNLKVTLSFTTAPEGQGVRGLTITNLKTVAIDPPCTCSTKASNGKK